MFGFVLGAFQCESFRLHTVPQYARTHVNRLCSCERLIGRHDYTAIIDHSRCRVKEMSFREIMSHGEA